MAVSSRNLTSCPKPFLSEAPYPSTGGYQEARFCAPITSTLSCCLPCPLVQWAYSDDFDRKSSIAMWFNVPALVCQVFLLVTYAVLDKKRSRRHHLSIGLCIALVMLELSFIIPLGARPEMCYNDITPNDMRSSLSCAWSGALLEAGSMAGCIWILLRSLWTHLRVCWDIQQTPKLTCIAQALGWGLPGLFLAISLPITGVSYRLGYTCLPNPHLAFVTWFGWLIAFASLAALIQFVTTGFCLIVYARSFFVPSRNTSGTSDSVGSAAPIMNPSRPAMPLAPRIGKALAYKRIKKVLVLQWRSIILSLLVVAEIIYFGTVYVAQARAAREAQKPENSARVEEWGVCIILSGGNKNQCLHLAEDFRLAESKVIASLFMSAIIGLFTFALMFRTSMLAGWWDFIHNPRLPMRRNSADDFVTVNQGHPKILSMSGPLASEQRSGRKLGTVLPSLRESVRQISIPEPGDVTERHGTTNLFDNLDDEDVEIETPRRVV